MKIIGLTGGIGSGKTTVTDFLKRKGYQVIDADVIAREIVEIGSDVLSELVSHFGESILQPDGSLNRQKLAELAFENSAQKDILDRITHGAIIETISSQIKSIQLQQKPSLVFVDAALLIGSASVSASGDVQASVNGAGIGRIDSWGISEFLECCEVTGSRRTECRHR